MMRAHSSIAVVLGLAVVASCSGPRSDSEPLSEVGAGTNPATSPDPSSRSDGCNSCTCDRDGHWTCTDNFCPLPAAKDPCVLPVNLAFHPFSNQWTQYHYRLSSPMPELSGTRGNSSLSDGGDMIEYSLRHCQGSLPACGATGEVSISTIIQDLADHDVQVALSRSTRQFYGTPDTETAWSIDVESRIAGIDVGGPCRSSEDGCTPIPAGIQRLTNDLTSLVDLCLD